MRYSFSPLITQFKSNSFAFFGIVQIEFVCKGSLINKLKSKSTINDFVNWEFLNLKI